MDSLDGEWIARIKSLKTLMGLTLWGVGTCGMGVLFRLVCGGVLVPSLACIVVKIWAMRRGFGNLDARAESIILAARCRQEI